MLQEQMLPGQMSPWQLPTNIDNLTNQSSKFGWVRTSNIKDMALFVIINYRDPHNNKKIKLANPVVNIAASSRTGVLFG